MLRPEPCSALIAPSYFSTTSSTRLRVKRAVALDRRGAAHVLGQHEVQVAVLGVAEHGRVRHVVALEEGLAVPDRLGQALDRERRCPRSGTPSRSAASLPCARRGPCAAARARRARPRPVVKRGGSSRRCRLRIVSTSVIAVGQRLGRPPAAARSGAPRAASRPRTGSGCSSRIARSDVASRISSASAAGHGERSHGARRRPRARPGRRAPSRVRAARAPCARSSPPRSPSVPSDADHQVRQDLGRAVVVQERVQAVAARVLGLELAADPARERRRRAGSRRAAPGAPRGARAARGAAGRRRRARAVSTTAPSGEHHHQAVERVVAVLRHAAAHARGVVRQDAADHGGVDRGRVGPDARAGGAPAAGSGGRRRRRAAARSARPSSSTRRLSRRARARPARRRSRPGRRATCRRCGR